MTDTIEAILKAKTTPIGTILNPESNMTWLVYSMYAAPHLNIDLPPISSIQHTASTDYSRDTVTTLISEIDSSAACRDQLESYNLEESYFLAQRDLDKLAIAVYTLYLYGSK